MLSGPPERDPQFDARARAAQPDDLATIIYTSGTTGIPKGAMLTHGNMAANVAYSLQGFDLGPGDLSLSFLPLSHVTARHLDLAMFHRGVVVAYVYPPTSFPKHCWSCALHCSWACRACTRKSARRSRREPAHSPNRGFSPGPGGRGGHIAPRFWPDKFRARWRGNWRDRLVYSQLRTGMGGCVKFYISGGAPLGRELAEWYADLGIRIHEGYGLTETSPVIALNKPPAHKLGTVGQPSGQCRSAHRCRRRDSGARAVGV